MPTIYEDILEVVQNFPDCTRSEVVGLLPHRNPKSVAPMINELVRANKLTISGLRPVPGKASVQTSRFNPDESSYRSVKTGKTKKKKLPRPTEEGWKSRIQELESQVAELEAWKKDALSRYPALAVDPLVLRAREIAARTYKASDPKHAQDIMVGKLDKTPIMMAVIAALEEGE